MATSRKDYRAAAEAFKVASAFERREARDALAHAARLLADHFKRDNPAFRYDRFFEACGLDAFGHVTPAPQEASA